jgi:hypothetical protein
MNTIYNLINPIDNSIFYVGVTTNIKNRFYQHYKGDKNLDKSNIVKSIRLVGKKPIINILKQVDNIELAEFIESEYIDLYKFNNIKLTNKNDGGNQPPSQKGIKQTEHTKRLRHLNSPLVKLVLQIDKNGNIVNQFNGVREACRITGIDHRSISQVASGSLVRKSAGGYKWSYKN